MLPQIQFGAVFVRDSIYALIFVVLVTSQTSTETDRFFFAFIFFNIILNTMLSLTEHQQTSPSSATATDPTSQLTRSNADVSQVTSSSVGTTDDVLTSVEIPHVLKYIRNEMAKAQQDKVKIKSFILTRVRTLQKEVAKLGDLISDTQSDELTASDVLHGLGFVSGVLDTLKRNVMELKEIENLE
jgi:hypothetical protein